MSGKRGHSDEVKAAVLAALLEGWSVNTVAERYGVPAGTVKSWKHRELTDPGPLVATAVATVATTKRSLGELIEALMEAELESLRRMAETFNDPQWLKKQEAGEVAILYGVMQDKVFRKLEALKRAASDRPAGD